MEKILSITSKKSKTRHSNFFYSVIAVCLTLLIVAMGFIIYKVVTPLPQNKVNEYSGAEKIAAEKAVNLPTGSEIVKAQIAVTDIKKTSLDGICNDDFTLSNAPSTTVIARYEVTLVKSHLFFYETYAVHICQY